MEDGKIGKKYNRLTLVSFSHYFKDKENRNIPYWNVKCDCGKEKTIRLYHVTREITKSCGCLQKENKHRLLPGESNFNVLFAVYQKNAELRGIKFELTKEEFRKFTKKNCDYCGIEPSTVFRRKNANGDYVYNGIDRVDNNDGYNLKNSVTCCETCNTSKLSQTREEFENWIKRAYNHLFSKEGKNE